MAISSGKGEGLPPTLLRVFVQQGPQLMLPFPEGQSCDRTDSRREMQTASLRTRFLGPWVLGVGTKCHLSQILTSAPGHPAVLS